jgi:PAP2 superfamily protein
MESLTGAEPQIALRAARVLLIAAGLAGWFWTQRILAARSFPAGRISDRIHEWTAPWNRYLLEHPSAADRLLVASSAIIDALGLFLLGSAVFGATVRPFLGLLLLFGLRQVCQGLTALPAPEGMIWRDPGFPSLLVTYRTASDLFFSGHTAIAVYGGVELARQGGPGLAALGAAVAAFEAATVLVVRAHYTMDVFTAIVVALWAAGVAGAVAPTADRLLAGLVGG